MAVVVVELLSTAQDDVIFAVGKLRTVDNSVSKFDCTDDVQLAYGELP